jgi:hypothetical protein
MNLIKTLTLSILVMSLAVAGEAEKLPASAQAVLDKAEAEKALKALESTYTGSQFAPCEHRVALGLEGTRLSRHQLSEVA